MEAYGHLGLAISKLTAAIENIKEAAKNQDILINANFFQDELIYLINNLAILQDKLKNK
jgi:hypothetical protein